MLTYRHVFVFEKIITQKKTNIYLLMYIPINICNLTRLHIESNFLCDMIFFSISVGAIMKINVLEIIFMLQINIRTYLCMQVK